MWVLTLATSLWENKCSWWLGKKRTFPSYSKCTDPNNPFPGASPTVWMRCLSLKIFWCHSHLPLNPLLHAFWAVVYMSLFSLFSVFNKSFKNKTANWQKVFWFSVTILGLLFGQIWSFRGDLDWRGCLCFVSHLQVLFQHFLWLLIWNVFFCCLFVFSFSDLR